MKTLLKIVAVVMVIFTSSIAFVDEYSDSDDDFNDDVFSATDAMKAYNKKPLLESLCSGAEFYSLSQDTIKFKARKIKCDSTGCIIQLKEKFKEKIIGPPLRPQIGRASCRERG